MSSNSDDDDSSLTVHLTVPALPTNPRIPLTISKTISPSELRKQVSEKTMIPLAKLRLIFRGRMVSDDNEKQVVVEYKLEHDSVLHCMGKPTTEEKSANAMPVPGAASTAGPTVSIQPGAATTAPAAGLQTTAAQGDPLQAALSKLKSLNSPTVFLTAVTTLDKLLANITTKPMEEKYRRVKKQNAAFQKRLGGLAGGDDAMKAAGFVTETIEGDEMYVMHASADAWPKLQATKRAVEAAVTEAKSAAQPAVPPAAAAAGGMPGAGFPGAGFPGAGFPSAGFPAMGENIPAGMANLMSDPQALQNFLNNPMVQQMMQNDPRLANNPMLQQSMQQIASNPAMINQISQMMRDPNMQSQFQAMMANRGGNPMAANMFGNPGSMPAGMQSQNNTNAGGNNNNNNNNSGAAQGATDQEQTEEELIAEAIRRSLEES